MGKNGSEKAPGNADVPGLPHSHTPKAPYNCGHMQSWVEIVAPRHSRYSTVQARRMLVSNKLCERRLHKPSVRTTQLIN